MKYTSVRLALTLLIGAVLGSSASAGFGLHGGSSGGASYGGSSGGASYGAGYGSSGYAVGYGSSGGGSYASSGGSSGGYTAAYGSSGGSSGRPGFLSRLHDRVHAHIAAKHARRASYGSSGYVAAGSSGGSSGGYVSHGSSGGGSSGGYYSGYSTFSGGSSGSASYGSSGSVSYGSTGSYGTSYGSAGSVAAPYYGTSTTPTRSSSALVSNSSSDDSVRLNVSVPESAVVYVNDRKTTSIGEVRQFVSRGLEAGKSYRFEVRAELNDNGRMVSDTKTIVVTAGSQENVRFALKATPKADAPVDTAVVLNVPENAEVTLAGNTTQVKGSTRVFKTSQLKSGEVWDDYVVQVKVGEQVKTQSIRLIAGDKLELSFNFDSENNGRLAAR